VALSTDKAAAPINRHTAGEPCDFHAVMKKRAKTSSVNPNGRPEPKKENLRQRAYLNSIASWANTGTMLVVGFVLNPYIVSRLGAMFYGVWQILGQLNSYMVMSDLQTSTTLKWVIAKDRTTATEKELRQSVAAALFANILILPFYATAGCIIIWLAPYVTKIDEEHFALVRTTSGLLVLAFIITQVLFIFESVLMAMNLSYKAMRIRPLITALAGVLTAGVLYLDWGLPGMAAVLVVVPVVTGAIIGRIVYAHVPWFGFARVTWPKVFGFFKLTGWFMALKIVDTANMSIDLILLGYLAGPTYVAAFTISRYSILAASTVCNSAFNAVTPGLSRLFGEKNYSGLLSARRQMLSLLWVYLAVCGAIVCVWNKDFVGIWTSPEYFTGQLETFLIVVVVTLKSIQVVDGSIVVMALEVKRNVTIGVFAALLTVALAWMLVPRYQTVGLLLSLLVGVLAMSAGYSLYAARLTQHSTSFFRTTYLTRTPVVCGIVLSIAALLGRHAHVDTWITLIGSIAATGAVAAVLLWFLALSSAGRRNAIDNVMKISVLNRV